MKFKKPASAEKLKKLMTRQRLQSVFSFALGALLLFQMVQFYQFRERLKFIDDLYDRDSAVMSDLNKGKAYLSSFGGDLNEIRQFLLLPAKDYDFSAMNDVDLASEESEPDLNTQIFDFVNGLGKYEQNEALYTANLVAVKAGVVDPAWAAAGLHLLSPDGQALEDHMEFVFKDGDVDLLKIDLGYDGLFTVPLYYREVKLTDRSSWTSVFSAAQQFLKEGLPALRDLVQKVNASRDSLKTLLASDGLQQVFRDKAMALSGEQENEESYFYQLRNSQLAALGSFAVFKRDGRMVFSVDTPVDADFEALDLDGTVSEDLLTAVRNQVDARTDIQKQVDSKKAEMDSIMTDRAFVATLDKLGLHFGVVTETSAAVQYPLLNLEGTVLRIIFIDKTTVEVKVSLPSGEEVRSLSMAIEELSTSGKKKAWICLIPFRITHDS